MSDHLAGQSGRGCADIDSARGRGRRLGPSALGYGLDMVMAREPCTGTLVEHEVGPVECTDDGCSAAPEEHWLVVRCVELVCRCGQDQTGERSTHPTSST